MSTLKGVFDHIFLELSVLTRPNSYGKFTPIICLDGIGDFVFLSPSFYRKSYFIFGKGFFLQQNSFWKVSRDHWMMGKL